MKKQTLTIALSAYNEEANIKNILSDILVQHLSCTSLKQIIVVSDGSTDSTVRIAKELSNTKIKLIEGKKNLGKASRLNQIIKQTNSDILILLDADAVIEDKKFIEKLIKPIVKGVADMTSADLDEFEAVNLTSSALLVSMKMKKILFRTFKNGNNIYTCHGPARALNRSMYKSLNFVRDEGEDMYSYFMCIKANKRYVFVPNAVIKYRLPCTIKDHEKQSVRFNKSKVIYSKKLDKNFVLSEFRIPVKTYIRAGFKALPIVLSNPVVALFYLFLFMYTKFKSLLNVDINSTWRVSSSKGVLN